MKKGNFAPRVRSRWVEGWYPRYSDYQLPTWCRPYDLQAVLVIEILGLPVPITIDQDDCGAARWAYVPSEGAVIWRGNWASAPVSGEWTYKQKIDNSLQSFNEFSMTHDDGLFNPRVIYDSAGEQVSGEWQGAFPRNPIVTHRRPGVTPWAFANLNQIYQMTYQKIRDWGADPNDTSPRTWNDDGLP